METNLVAFKSTIIKSSNIRNFDVYLPHSDQFPTLDRDELAQMTEQVYHFTPKQPEIKNGKNVLHFGGRVKLDSSKNHILVSPQFPDQQLLLFGKVSEKEYICDFRYPMSPFHAFSICLPHFAK